MDGCVVVTQHRTTARSSRPQICLVQLECSGVLEQTDAVHIEAARPDSIQQYTEGKNCQTTAIEELPSERDSYDSTLVFGYSSPT